MVHTIIFSGKMRQWVCLRGSNDLDGNPGVIDQNGVAAPKSPATA